MKVTVTRKESYSDAHNPAYVESVTEFHETLGAFNNEIATAHARFIIASARYEAAQIVAEAKGETVEDDPPVEPDLSTLKPPAYPEVSPTQTLTRVAFRLDDGREGLAYVQNGEKVEAAIVRAVADLPPVVDVEPDDVIEI